jgi:PKD repeat protein
MVINMYYNINDQILISRVPKNLIKDDGSVLLNFHTNDIHFLADNGYYTVRNDNSNPPELNSIEIESKKEIVLDKPYVDIVRTWVSLSVADLSPVIKLEESLNNETNI